MSKVGSGRDPEPKPKARIPNQLSSRYNSKTRNRTKILVFPKLFWYLGSGLGMNAIR